MKRSKEWFDSGSSDAAADVATVLSLHSCPTNTTFASATHPCTRVESVCYGTSDRDQHLAAASRDLLLRAVPTRAVEDVIENVVAAGLDLAVVA